MSARVRTTTELREALERRLNELKASFEADAVTLHLYDSQRERLYFPVGVNLLQEERFMRGAPSMERVTGKIVRSGAPVIAEDAEHHPDLTGPFTHVEKVKAAAGFPLLVPDSDEVVGVLFIDYRRPHQFKKDEIECIQSQTSGLAQFIGQSMQGDPGRMLRDALRMETDLRLEEARLQDIINRLWNILGDADVALWTRVRGQRDLRIKIHEGLDRNFADNVSVNLDTDSSNMIAAAFVEGEEEVLIESPQTDSGAIFNVAALPTWERMLAVPVSSEHRLLGVLSVFRRERIGFTRRESDLIRAFANLIAVTIENEERIIALNALHDVGVRLTLATDLSEILQEVVRSACQVIGADVATVHLYDPAGQEFRDLEYATVFPPEARADMEKPRGKDGLSARIIEQGRIWCEDVREQADQITFSTFVKDQGLKAYVGTRLTSIDEPLGVLYVSFREKRRFSPEDLALIQILANYASTAIYRSELLVQRATVTEIAREITSKLDREKLLETVLQQSLHLLKCKEGSIALFDKSTGELVLQYAEGKQKWAKLPRGEGLMGATAKLREPVRVGDVSKDDRYVEHVAETRSELDVPLMIGDRLIGVLNFESPRYDAFSEEDERLAEALAAQAAVAFRTAELYEEAQARLQERIDDIRALQGIYALLGTAPLKNVLEQIAEEAARLTPAKYTGIWLLDEQARELRFGARNRREEEPTRSLLRLPLDETSINGYVALTGKTHLCNNVKGDPYYKEWFEEVQSELTTPLIYRNRVIGTLNLESTQIGAFTDDHVRLVEALAGAAAVAIQSARLYKAIQTVNEVGRALTSGIRLREDEVLKLIRNQASELMDTDNMYIALYDEATDTVRFGLAFVDGKRVDVEGEEGWQPRRAGKGRTEWIIHRQQSILVTTKAEAEAWYEQPGHEEYIGTALASWLGVSMTVGEKVIGVIATYHPTRDHVYGEDDLAVLQVLANQAAIALDNARLYYDVNQRLQVLIEVGQMLSSGIQLKEPEVLKLIYEQSQRLTGTRDMYVALYDENTEEISFELAMENGKPVEVGIGGWATRKADMEERGRTEDIILTGKPILHQTSQDSLDWYKHPGHKEFLGRVACSYLGVPMSTGEKILGVLAIYDWEREYAYNEADLTVLSSMASQAAIALENVRLYAEARSEVIAAKQLATLGIAIAALQHRINNTFNIIVPNVTRLRKRVDMTNETIAEILDIIERNARYTSDIIARIQEPLREVETQDVDVNAVLDEVMSVAGEQWPGIDVTPNLDDSIPLIQAPIGQVTEVFRNLVDNACRAMEGSGQIVVASHLTEGKISVRVEDTGPGIPLLIQQRLFVKPVPSGEPGGGAGLGLWLSRLMLQTIGGDVIIEKSDPTGTTMVVQIPVLGAEKEV